MQRAVFPALVAVCAVASPAPVAIAKPLDAEICKNLTAQRDELETRGVRQIVTGGPAVAQHTPKQLADVRQFLDLEGQLRFRCPFDQSLAALKDDAPDEQEGNGAPVTDSGTAATPKDAKTKKAPVAKNGKTNSAKATAATDAATREPDGKAETTKREKKAAAAPRPAAKPKDDAYRPPAEGTAGSSTLDQQAKQAK